MTFGVVSDIHVRIAPDGNGMRTSHDSGETTAALMKFPNAVAVFGGLPAVRARS